MTDKKTKSDPLVAAETILIEGKAFERGERVTGVDKDELARAVSQRRVIRKSVFDAQGVPAPAIGGTDPETGDDADADADDTGDAGDSGDSGGTA